MDFLEVLDAERTQLAAEDRLAQVRTDAATSLIAVYKALGGGWEMAPTPRVTCAKREAKPLIRRGSQPCMRRKWPGAVGPAGTPGRAPPRSLLR